MFRDDDGEVAGGEEEGLIAEESRDSFQWHWAAMTAKFRESVTFRDAVCVPSHYFYTPKRTVFKACPVENGGNITQRVYPGMAQAGGRITGYKLILSLDAYELAVLSGIKTNSKRSV
jgi:hypothetical protein